MAKACFYFGGSRSNITFENLSAEKCDEILKADEDVIIRADNVRIRINMRHVEMVHVNES